MGPTTLECNRSRIGIRSKDRGLYAPGARRIAPFCNVGYILAKALRGSPDLSLV